MKITMRVGSANQFSEDGPVVVRAVGYRDKKDRENARISEISFQVEASEAWHFAPGRCIDVTIVDRPES